MSLDVSSGQDRSSIDLVGASGVGAALAVALTVPPARAGGRQNWPMIGNGRGGHAAAALYTLVQACKETPSCRRPAYTASHCA